MTYKLPEGRVVINFSGGRTSGFMLYQILQENGNLPDRVKIVFANTGREMPETLDFVNECGQRWSVSITWLEYNRREGKVTFDEVNHNSASRDGSPFEKLITAKKYVPNVMSRFCTEELKVRTVKRYLVSEGWTAWTSCLGIRADEPSRIRTQQRDRWSFWYPLKDTGVTKRDVAAFWKSQNFNLNLVGPNGVTPKGNCDGCFLKSEATLAMMLREHPERMNWWVDMEKKVNGTFNKRQSFAQLQDFVSRQGDWLFDDEAYLCQQDYGECTE